MKPCAVENDMALDDLDNQRNTQNIKMSEKWY